MQFAEAGRRVFEASSAIAVYGFISLIVQTLLAKYVRRKRQQTTADSPVTLSEGTPSDEPQKPATAYGGSSEHARGGPDQAWKRPLHDRIHAMIPQALPTGSDDGTTPEIARAAGAYLLAAEDLLRLRHGGGAGGAKAPRTPAELHAAAGLVVRNTTAATASLRDLRPLDRAPSAGAARLTGAISLLALLVALMASPVAGALPAMAAIFMFGFPAIGAMTIVASTSSTKAELEGTLGDVEKKA